MAAISQADKMVAICRRHEIRFMNENLVLLIRISLKFVPKGLIDNKSAFVQVMAWRWTSDKSLSETMLTQFTDAYLPRLGDEWKIEHQESSCSNACQSNIDGLAQDCSNSNALAVELLQSCAKLSTWPTANNISSHSCILQCVPWLCPWSTPWWYHDTETYRITGSSWGESTGDQWSPFTKGQ